MTTIVINREHLGDFIGQIEPILRLHHFEVLQRPQAELEPDWDLYVQMERQGQFIAHVARGDDDRILAYAGFFLVPDFHRRGDRIAQNDVFYVLPEQRDGVLGPRMIRHCERDMRARGAARIVFTAQEGTPFDALLPALGYLRPESPWTKNLKE